MAVGDGSMDDLRSSSEERAQAAASRGMFGPSPAMERLVFVIHTTQTFTSPGPLRYRYVIRG